ncbi:HNH endonuclease [Halobacillus trueperi]|uniref:HNH endonuclease n=1 Tax=Halobacillus trueperi TaxID=156205 RepID=A0A3D8VLU8_9BACI|nr:HNH endonuclease [Halobacillus trueperi]
MFSKVSFEMVKVHRIEMKAEIANLFKYTKLLPPEDQDGVGLAKYKHMVDNFVNKYKVDERKISLSIEEKQGLLSKQNNICPLCNGKVFISDDIEVDHKNPLGVGGRDKFLNLQITHKDCNRKKGVTIIK